MHDFIIAKIKEQEAREKEETQIPLYLDLPIEEENIEEVKKVEEDRGIFIIEY